MCTINVILQKINNRIYIIQNTNWKFFTLVFLKIKILQYWRSRYTMHWWSFLELHCIRVCRNIHKNRWKCRCGLIVFDRDQVFRRSIKYGTVLCRLYAGILKKEKKIAFLLYSITAPYLLLSVSTLFRHTSLW